MLESHGNDYASLTAVSEAIAQQVGVGKEAVRRWALQAQVNAGTRAGTTAEEAAENKKLKAENKQLREDVTILKAATTFFAGELAPVTFFIVPGIGDCGRQTWYDFLTLSSMIRGGCRQVWWHRWTANRDRAADREQVSL